MDNNRNLDDESGIGLIEIVVSILLLGLLAMSALPLMVQGLKLAPKTAAIATATELVASEVNRVQRFDTCSTLTAQGGTLPVTVGTVDYEVVTTVAACPGTYPGTVRVTVEAGQVSGDPLATSDLLVYVGAAL